MTTEYVQKKTPSTIKPEIIRYRNTPGTENSGSCLSGESVVLMQNDAHSESTALSGQTTLNAAQQKAFLRTIKKHKKELDLLAE